MNCCDDFGDCNQGRNCPVRKQMALRDEVEKSMGVAKIGQRHHAAKAYPPSAWKKSLKYWAALWLGVALGAMSAGVLVVLLEVVV
jgi:hypothetical protein